MLQKGYDGRDWIQLAQDRVQWQATESMHVLYFIILHNQLART
jgi:hypothetical protein